jgi:hypothetical protein
LHAHSSAPVARELSVIPGLAIGEAEFAELIDTCRHLDGSDLAPPAAAMAGITANRQCRSFLRHAGLAQPGEISAFDQGTDLRHPPIEGPQAGQV